MRRVIAAAVLAVVIATGAVVVEQTMTANAVQPSPCAGLDPNDNWFQWWLYSCDGGSGPGGGGSGAGMD